MILRIERVLDGNHIALRLIGHLSWEHLAQLRSLIEDGGPAVVLDLSETTLVDVNAVHFLTRCQAEGIELRHCSLYIREWMDRDEDREA